MLIEDNREKKVITLEDGAVVILTLDPTTAQRYKKISGTMALMVVHDFESDRYELVDIAVGRYMGGEEKTLDKLYPLLQRIGTIQEIIPPDQLKLQIENSKK